MHPCLGIAEIEERICDLLSRRDLYAVACTCKAFKETALPQLWKEIGLDLSNGFRMLSVMYLRQISVQREWGHIAPYAKWVHNLVIWRLDLQNPSLVSALTSLNTLHFFPNLRYLDITPTTELTPLAVFNALLPSTLTQLSLKLTNAQGADQILSQLGSMCPSIRIFALQLAIMTELDYLIISHSVSQSVAQWDKLVCLDAPVLQIEALQHLSQLPGFSSLTLYGRGHITQLRSELLPELESMVEGFDALRRVEIKRCPLDWTTSLLDRVTTRLMDRVHVGVNPQSRDMLDEWEAYFWTVARLTSAAPLTDLVISGLVWDKERYHGQSLISTSLLEDTNMRRLGKDVLRAFINPERHGNLTTLDFSDCYIFEMSDGLVEEIARASPKLNHVDFGTRRKVGGQTTTLTLNSYFHLFEHCKDLKVLGLVVDTDISLLEERVVERLMKMRERDAKEKGKSLDKAHGGDFALYVGSSVVREPRELAAFFLPWFKEPMGTLDFAVDQSMEILEGWAMFEDWLAVLMEERTRRLELLR